MSAYDACTGYILVCFSVITSFLLLFFSHGTDVLLMLCVLLNWTVSVLPTDQRKCTLTECWAVLTYSICPNKSVNRKCTWYRNNLGYTKKNTPVTFFSPSLTVQRWAPLGGIQGTKQGFFSFFPYFILCCIPIFWSLFTSCCSLYLPPLSASTSAQRKVVVNAQCCCFYSPVSSMKSNCLHLQKNI